MLLLLLLSLLILYLWFRPVNICLLILRELVGVIDHISLEFLVLAPLITIDLLLLNIATIGLTSTDWTTVLLLLLTSIAT
jgi:hypothetical protein